MNDSEFKSFLTAFFELWERDVEGRVGLEDVSLGAKLPEVEEFVLAFFIGGEDREVVIFGLDELYHVGDGGGAPFNDCHGVEGNNLELVHAEHCDAGGVQRTYLGAEHVFFLDDVE